MSQLENFFQNYRSKKALSSFLYYAIEWGQYQDITHLTLPLPKYTKGRRQGQAIPWILTQRLSMKLLGSQFHKDYTYL